MSMIRKYYYHIDLKGLLYLNSTTSRNIASCLKDKNFLQFFHQQLRFNNNEELYKWISPCGKELNYVKHEDDNACLGFTSLDRSNDKLLYAQGTLSCNFDPSALMMNRTNGRLYHPVFGHRHLSNYNGLISASVASELSDYITNDNNSDVFQIRWKSNIFVIKSL